MRETTLSDNAISVLRERYYRKDETGRPIEDWAGLCKRVSDFLFPEDETLRERANDLMYRRVFLPNTPALVNAGRENGQLSACFVLPIEDSMDGIFTTLHDAAMIHKTGGGTGFSFSRLRPKNSLVHSTNGKASGVLSFLEVFNAATESVKQGGVRRGANMGVLRVDHPEIMDWIMCKDDPSVLHNFNLSVGITDKFMEAVNAEDDSFFLIDPSTGEITETVHARDIWKQLIHQAWKNGEPGIIFLDTVNRANPTPEYGDFESTNPCGEQPLLPYESCNLGSIDLAKCVKAENGGKITIDWDMLRSSVTTAVHILNAVIDRNSFPLDKIRENTLRTRKIGLGVMGWADFLLKLGIPYDSDRAVGMARTVMWDIDATAHNISDLFDYGNATCTTIAPTGTISVIADTSGGIEPNFSFVYKRNLMDKLVNVVNPVVEKYLKKQNLYREDILEKLERGVPVKDIPELSALGEVWKASQEIAPEWHVKMQAAFQTYTDNAVSKTINLPNSASEADVDRIFRDAYELECKGITVYRDGSRENQVMNHKADETKPEKDASEGCTASKKPRPAKLFGSTVKKRIGCGKLYVTVNHDGTGSIEEVFTTTGKGGGCPSQSEATSRIVSLALRYGVPAEDIASQLRGIRCKNCIHRDGLDAMSCPDAIGRAMEEALKDAGDGISKTLAEMDTDASSNELFYDYGVAELIGRTLSLENTETGVKAVIAMKSPIDECPECGGTLIHAEGCVRCTNCSYSKCNG